MQLNNTRNWFIGIDGGGTKTEAAICDSSGSVQGRAAGDGSNPLSRPWPEVEETLRALVGEVCRQAGADPGEVQGLFLGMAGADRPEVRTRVEEAFRPSWGERLHIDNDALAALYAGTWGAPGIVLIAGTGSIAYAVTADGQRHRAGGWGYLLGDEGSGFDLGRQAVISVLRAWDGRGEPTELSELVTGHFGIDRPDQLIARVYGTSNPRKMLAEASVLVESAARAGDAVAARLIKQAAASLLELAESCRARAGSDLPVVLAGGMLAADTLLRRCLLESARFEVRRLQAAPVAGCLAAALMRAGLSMDEQVRAGLALLQTDGVEEDAHGGELA